MKISKDFESGSIEVVSIDEPMNIQLKLTSDNQSCTKQWFYFELTTHEGEPHRIRVTNAGEASFPDGWQNYQVLASYDRDTWFRVDTRYKAGELIIEYTPAKDRIFFAYYVPYTERQYQALMEQIQPQQGIKHEVLGYSNDGNPIDLLTFGKPSRDKKRIWMIARQHPGETMAQWLVDGLLRALSYGGDVMDKLLENTVLYLVPNMNPDGTKLGNHRTNSAGVDLNRAWAQEVSGKSPEVELVKRVMATTGVDMFIDVHGDEALPYNFAMVEETHPFGEGFKRQLVELTGDFQTQYDYDNRPNRCGTSCCGPTCQSVPAKATEYVASKYGCPSILLELSFKELANSERESQVWTGKECQVFGGKLLRALARALDEDKVKMTKEN